jgi:hypothetical protein
VKISEKILQPRDRTATEKQYTRSPSPKSASDIVTKVRKTGARTIASLLVDGDDNVLLSLTEAYVPAFLAILAANPLRRAQLVPMSMDAVACIKRIRHQTDLATLRSLASPLAQQPCVRASVTLAIGKFVLALYAATGHDGVKALELMVVSCVNYARSRSMDRRWVTDQQEDADLFEDEFSGYDLTADTWEDHRDSESSVFVRTTDHF